MFQFVDGIVDDLSSDLAQDKAFFFVQVLHTKDTNYNINNAWIEIYVFHNIIEVTLIAVEELDHVTRLFDKPEA